MTVYDKKLKELSIILQQDNIFKVKAAIRSLRESPSFEGAIGLLVSLYDRSPDQSLKKIIADFNEANVFGAQIVTQINHAEVFYPAEDYHQDYFDKNPANPYCLAVAAPKSAKIRAKFAQLIKN